MTMDYKHTKLERHPLRDCWMGVKVTFPYVPPYFGTKRECEKALIHAERNAEKMVNSKSLNGK